MNLSWLRTFVAVAKTGSFSQTARELNLTQPAVSKHIAGLESYYGIKLIDRSRRSITLTEAGTSLLPLARGILDTVERAGQEMDSFINTVKGSLTIGASTIPGQYVLPKIIGRFREHYPQVHISLEIADTGKISRYVLEGKLLLGAVGALQPVSDLNAIPFAEDELVLIIPTGHTLARRKTVSLSDLSGKEIVWRESDSGTRYVLEQSLQNAGIALEDLRIIAQMGSTEAVLGAVEAGMGISFVSKWAAESKVKTGLLVMRRVKGLNLTRSLYLIYPKGRTLPRPVKTFLDFAAQQRP